MTITTTTMKTPKDDAGGDGDDGNGDNHWSGNNSSTGVPLFDPLARCTGVVSLVDRRESTAIRGNSESKGPKRMQFPG